MSKLPLELEQKIILTTNDFNTICSSGDEDCIDRFYDKKVHTWDWAAEKGYLEVIKWLHNSKQEGCTPETMVLAAQHGQLEVVKWLYNNLPEIYTTDTIFGAATNGHLEIVKFLYDPEKKANMKFLMFNASMAGHLEVVKFLHEKNTEKIHIDKRDLDKIVNNLKSLKILYEKQNVAENKEDYKETCKKIKVMEWLYENRQG